MFCFRVLVMFVVVVKLGLFVVVDDVGALWLSVVACVCEEVVVLYVIGVDVIVVMSGVIVCGMYLFAFFVCLCAIEELQVVLVVG